MYVMFLPSHSSATQRQRVQCEMEAMLPTRVRCLPSCPSARFKVCAHLEIAFSCDDERVDELNHSPGLGFNLRARLRQKWCRLFVFKVTFTHAVGLKEISADLAELYQVMRNNAGNDHIEPQRLKEVIQCIVWFSSFLL